MQWKPKGYQKSCIKFMLQHGAAGLLLDPGLGKTSISLAFTKIMREEGLTNGVLIVAPLRPCYLVWPAEAKKWDDFSGLSVGILHGPNKDDVLREKHDIYVINPEGLQWLLTPKNMKLLRCDILIVDESTKFKHSTTRRFLALKPWLPKFNRRYILTGTPTPNGLMDLFGQVYILDLGHALGGFVTHFRAAFFEPDGPFGWKLKEHGERDIIKRIQPLCIRMSAKDYLELPPLIDQTLQVELPPKARRTYQEMEHLLITKLRSQKVVTAANVGVATGKCRQITNGGIFFSDLGVKKQGFEHIHDAKVDALIDLIEETSGQPMLVLYEFGHDLDRLKVALKKKLGLDAPHIGGGTTTKRTAELEHAWNRGELPVLLAQPQSVGLGLNLQDGGPHVTWFSIPWDLEVYDQTTQRVWRQGVKHAAVFRHHIVARETIDELVLGVLASKQRVQSDLLRALQARAK